MADDDSCNCCSGKDDDQSEFERVIGDTTSDIQDGIAGFFGVTIDRDDG